MVRAVVVLGSAFCILTSALAADAADYPKLLGQTVQIAKEALQGQPDKRSADRARFALLVLAELAQQDLAGPDGAQRATVRDAAIALAARIKAKEYDAARKDLDALATLPAQPSAKKEKTKIIDSLVEIDDVMTLFREPKLGGLGIEAEFDKLGAAKGPLPATALDDRLLLFAHLAAVTGAMAEAHIPDKKQKEWKSYALVMKKTGLELADAVKAKDGKAALAALGRANANCAACHKVFR